MAVELTVEASDALDWPTGLLVLKHAQDSYGVDRVALDRIGRLPGPLPGVGRQLLVPAPNGIRAAAVMFVGVPELRRFSYAEIRTFGDRALSLAATAAPWVEDISATLHGANFGLDETEAFRSEVAGFLDAIDGGRIPSRLQRVTVLERDVQRARRLRAVLDSMGLSAGLTEGHGPESPFHAPGTAGSQLGSVGFDSASRPHAFVAMPFASEFDDRFHFGIAPPIRDAGLICERMDDLSFTGDVLEMMRHRIQDARIVIADVTASNPNVYLEIGFAWASDRPTIILCHKDTEPLFDIRGHRHLRYSSIRELEEKLSKELAGIL